MRNLKGKTWGEGALCQIRRCKGCVGECSLNYWAPTLQLHSCYLISRPLEVYTGVENIDGSLYPSCGSGTLPCDRGREWSSAAVYGPNAESYLFAHPASSTAGAVAGTARVQSMKVGDIRSYYPTGPDTLRPFKNRTPERS